jgi:hypothetical protein
MGRAPPGANHPRSSCCAGGCGSPDTVWHAAMSADCRIGLYQGVKTPGCAGERLRAAHAPSSPLRQTLRVNYVSLILSILAIGISLASLIRHGQTRATERQRQPPSEWRASTRLVTPLKRCGYATQARAHRCRPTGGLRGLGGWRPRTLLTRWSRALDQHRQRRWRGDDTCHRRVVTSVLSGRPVDQPDSKP